MNIYDVIDAYLDHVDEIIEREADAGSSARATFTKALPSDGKVTVPSGSTRIDSRMQPPQAGRQNIRGR